MQKSLISVIVCHHVGFLVDKAIESLLKTETEDKFEIEIIIATSDKPSVQRLKDLFPKTTVLEIKGGPARKRNVSTRFAKGQYFAFFDDDVEVNPYTIFYLLQSLLEPNVGMVYGKLLNMEHRNILDEAGSFLTWSGFLYARSESGIEDKGQYEESCQILAGKSASCIVSRKAFWHVGGFDESFEILGEETDLSWRIWLSGYKVIFCPKSVTYHAFNTRFKPASFYTPARVYFNGCRNYFVMLLANYAVKNLPIPILCQTLGWTASLVGFFITGKFEAGWNILKAFHYLATHSWAIIQKRKFAQNLRVVPDAVLIPQITHNPPLSYYFKRLLHYIKTGRHG